MKVWKCLDQLRGYWLFKEYSVVWSWINPVVLVCKRIIPTVRPQHFGEISAKFADRGCCVGCATDPHDR
jgi:hypothetical protein